MARKTPEAVEFIRHFEAIQALGRTLIVVIYMRVSSWEQRQRQNLRNRRRWLRKALRKAGVKARCSYSEVASGKSLNGRPKFLAAIRRAKKLQHVHPKSLVVVVTDTRNRILRGENYNGQAHTDPPCRKQYKELAALAEGILLATILHPDTPFAEVRSHETRIPDSLGDSAGKKVGRPPRRVFRPRLTADKHRRTIHEIQSLQSKGWSQRKIAKKMDCPESTLRGWLKR